MAYKNPNELDTFRAGQPITALSAVLLAQPPEFSFHFRRGEVFPVIWSNLVVQAVNATGIANLIGTLPPVTNLTAVARLDGVSVSIFVQPAFNVVAALTIIAGIPETGNFIGASSMIGSLMIVGPGYLRGVLTFGTDPISSSDGTLPGSIPFILGGMDPNLQQSGIQVTLVDSANPVAVMAGVANYQKNVVIAPIGVGSLGGVYAIIPTGNPVGIASATVISSTLFLDPQTLIGVGDFKGDTADFTTTNGTLIGTGKIITATILIVLIISETGDASFAEAPTLALVVSLNSIGSISAIPSIRLSANLNAVGSLVGNGLVPAQIFSGSMSIAGGLQGSPLTVVSANPGFDAGIDLAGSQLFCVGIFSAVGILRQELQGNLVTAVTMAGVFVIIPRATILITGVGNLHTTLYIYPISTTAGEFREMGSDLAFV